MSCNKARCSSIGITKKASNRPTKKSKNTKKGGK